MFSSLPCHDQARHGPSQPNVGHKVASQGTRHLLQGPSGPLFTDSVERGLGLGPPQRSFRGPLPGLFGSLKTFEGGREGRPCRFGWWCLMRLFSEPCQSLPCLLPGKAMLRIPRCRHWWVPAELGASGKVTQLHCSATQRELKRWRE